MATCKDCVHYECCSTFESLAIRIILCGENADKRCGIFKNRADFAEVKHGYNATDMHPVDEFVCSVCGFICQDYTEMVYDEDGEYTYYRECEFKYCPNCGAIMDGCEADG